MIKEEECRVCGEEIKKEKDGSLIEGGYFKIMFLPVPICKRCADAITKQHINYELR